jgi:hypothetical protein
MSAAPSLPPFAVIRDALRRTTERLAHELADPAEAAPDWNEFEWGVARAASALQGISVLLANRLRWRGPENWRAFLDEQRVRSIERERGIDVLLERLDRQLRASGAGCVALKGAALRALDLYLPGERPMGDIDLLAVGENLPRATEAILELDYAAANQTARHAIFVARTKGEITGYGEHPDNSLNIELHAGISEPLPVSAVDISTALGAHDVVPGLNPYPDVASLMRHLLIHTAGNIRSHCLRLIQLHDLAVLARRLGTDDWRALLSPAAAGGSWWMLPPLELTARYFKGSIPAEVLAAARETCPPLLRVATSRATLTQVSWSNLRIAALPGICWSRSPREVLRLVRSRLLPKRRALAELQMALEVMPVLNQERWYGEHHAARILRWMFSRPPRVQTIVSVRAALDRRQPS